MGDGGARLRSAISGLDAETIGGGRGALDGALAERPSEQTGRPGGGQPSDEKKERALVEPLKA
jgi:hypothetical protein